MEPVNEKKYFLIENRELKESTKAKSSITDLARFVVNREADASVVTKVRDLFYNRYKGKPFGTIRNFFYLLFHRTLKEQLDNRFERLEYKDLERLIELVPEFIDLPEGQKNAIRTFLKYLPLDRETRDRIDRSLRQGTLEPLFALVRSHVAYAKLFPEIIQAAATLRGLVRVTIHEGAADGEKWIQDLKSWKPEAQLLNPDEQAMKQRAKRYVEGFSKNPTAKEAGKCFRELYTWFSLIDPNDTSENYELCSLVHKIRPLIQSFLQKEKEIERAKPRPPVTVSDPEFVPDVEDRISAVTSSGQLLLRMIDLVDAQSRLLAHKIVTAPAGETQTVVERQAQAVLQIRQGYSPVSFFMPELGLPSTSHPTFCFVKKDNTDRIFLQAEQPDTPSKTVLVEVIGNTLVPPSKERSLMPTLVAAYYLMLNKSYEEAQKILPFAYCSQFSLSSDEKKIMTKLWSMLQNRDLTLRITEKGVAELALVLAAIELRTQSKEPVGFTSSIKDILIKTANEHIQHADLEAPSKEVLRGFGAPVPVPEKPVVATPVSVVPKFRAAPKLTQANVSETFDLNRISNHEEREKFRTFFEPLGVFNPLPREDVSHPETMRQVQEQYRLWASVAYQRARTPPPEVSVPNVESYSAVYGMLNRISFTSPTPSGQLEVVRQECMKVRVQAQQELRERTQALLFSLEIMHQPNCEINELLVLYAQEQLATKFQPEQIVEIQKSIQEYLVAVQDVQKSNRIMDNMNEFLAHIPEKEADFVEIKDRVLQTIQRNRAYDYTDSHCYRYQVFEVLADVLILPKQLESLGTLGDPARSVILQLLMGGGKTFLLMPFLALLRANGTNISMGMIPQSLRPEVVRRFREVLGRGYDRLVTDLHIEEGSAISLQAWEHIEEKLNEAQESRGCLIVSPEDIHAALNTYTELLSKLSAQPSGQPNDELRRKLLCLTRILKTLKDKATIIGDEVDDLLKTSLEHVIAQGDSHVFNPVDATLVSELVLASIPLAKEKRIRLDFSPDEGKLCTKELYHTQLKPDLVQKALELLKNPEVIGQPESENWCRRLSSVDRVHIERYLLCEKVVGDNQEIKDAEKYVSGLPDDVKNRLAGLRFTLNYILPSTYEREWNKDQGYLDNKVDVVASPFGGAGVWTGTQYSNPYEQVACTVQTLLRQGPPLEALRQEGTLAIVGGIVYSQSRPSLANCLALVRPEKCKKYIQEDPEALRAYLHSTVFPKIVEYDRHIASDPQQLVDAVYRFSGITGTSWNMPHMPGLDEFIRDVPEEIGSLMRLYEKEQVREIEVIKNQDSSQKDFLKSELSSRETSPTAHIDGAGWLREIQFGDFTEQMRLLAQDLLAQRPDLTHVYFYDQDNNILVLERGQAKERPLQASDENIPKLQRMTIYDQRHTFGADIAQESNALAVLTIGINMTLRDFQQAIFRMRKIQQHQRVRILVDQHALQAIRMKLRLNETDPITLHTLLRFLTTVQEMKKVEECYSSAQKRSHVILSSALRQAIFGALEKEPPDLLAAKSIFDAGKKWLVRDEHGSAWEKYGKIPRECPSRDTVAAAVAKEVQSLQSLSALPEVKAVLGTQDLKKLVEDCYDTTQFSAQLLDHDPQNFVGRTHHVQQRQEVVDESVKVREVEQHIQRLQELVAQPHIRDRFGSVVQEVLGQFTQMTDSQRVALRSRVDQLLVNVALFTELSSLQQDASQNIEHPISDGMSSCPSYGAYQTALEELRGRGPFTSDACVSIADEELGPHVTSLKENMERVLSLKNSVLREHAICVQDQESAYNRASATELDACIEGMQEGSLRTVLSCWKDEVSQAAHLLPRDVTQRHIDAIIQAIRSCHDIQVVERVGRMLTRAEFVDIRTICTAQSLFLHEKQEIEASLTSLSTRFSRCEVLQRLLRRIQNESFSAEDLVQVQQEAMAVQSFLGALSLVQDQVRTSIDQWKRLALHAEAPFVDLLDRITHEVHAKIDTASQVLTEDSVRDIQLFLSQSQESIEALHELLQLQHEGQAVLAQVRFSKNAPASGHVRELFEEYARVRSAVQQALQVDVGQIVRDTDRDVMARRVKAQSAILSATIQILKTWNEKDVSEAISDDIFELQKVESELQEYSNSLSPTQRKSIDQFITSLQKITQASAEGHELTLEEYCEKIQQISTLDTWLQRARKAKGVARDRFNLRSVQVGHVKCSGLRDQFQERLAACSDGALATRIQQFEQEQKDIYDVERQTQALVSILRAPTAVLTELQQRLQASPQLQSLFFARHAALMQRGAEIGDVMRDMRASKDIVEYKEFLQHVSVDVQALAVEVALFSGQVGAGVTLHDFLTRIYANVASLSKEEYVQAYALVHELALDQNVMENQEWRQLLNNLAVGLATHGELLSEAISLVKTITSDAAEGKRLVQSLIQSCRDRQLQTLREQIEGNVRALRQHEGIVTEHMYSQFRLDLNESYESMLGHFAALLETSGLSDEDKRMSLEEFQNLGSALVRSCEVGESQRSVPIFGEGLEHCSLAELESRFHFVTAQHDMYEEVLAVAGLEAGLGATIQALVQQLEALAQSIRTIVQQKNAQLGRKATVAKVRQVAGKVLFYGGIVGLGLGANMLIPQVMGLLGKDWITQAGYRLYIAPILQSVVRTAIIGRGVQGVVQTVADPVFTKLESALPQHLQFLGRTGRVGVEVLTEGLVRGQSIGIGATFMKKYLSSLAQITAQKTLTQVSSRLSMKHNVVAQTAALGLGMGVGLLSSEGAQGASSMLIGAAYQNMVHMVAQPAINKMASKLPTKMQAAARFAASTAVQVAADVGQKHVVHAAQRAARGAVSVAAHTVKNIGKAVHDRSQAARDLQQGLQEREASIAEARRDRAEGRAQKKALARQRLQDIAQGKKIAEADAAEARRARVEGREKARAAVSELQRQREGKRLAEEAARKAAEDAQRTADEAARKAAADAQRAAEVAARAAEAAKLALQKQQQSPSPAGSKPSSGDKSNFWKDVLIGLNPFS